MNTQLLREAADWRLISLLFECPSAAWLKQVCELSGEVTDPTLKTAAAAIDEASAAQYYTTFGPGGPAAPREVSYRQSLMPGQMLEEIGAYYEAFAYRPAVEEPVDHIAVLTGFVAYLRLKEAFGNAEQAEIAAAAARKFIDDHLSVIAEPLAKSLAHSEITYLAKTADALLKRTGPARQPSVVPPVAAEMCATGCVMDQDADE